MNTSQSPTATGPAARPLPTPSELTQGFWEAAARGELVVQRCDGCGLLRHYPQPMCAACHSTDWTWTPVSGRGVVYTFTVTHQAFHPAWAGAVPYAVATVELEEGVRMVADLPAEDTDDVAIGLPVEVFFDEVPTADGGRFTLPRFRLRRDGPAAS
jgi:uncharacterized OB-fold protein